ncbi:MAG: hypothetical protein JXA54_10995 [Candidatus Heimdallarchaeota archaeon]|nr:hypothetical protein [Candidatus Heimdallarchaeota archaeon]
MTKKLTNIIVISTLVLILIGSNINTTNAAVRSWNIGDTFKYGFRVYLEEFYIDYELDEVKADYIIDQTSEFSINITAINNLTLTFEYYTFDAYGTSGPETDTYDSDQFINSLTLNNLFSGVAYEWDYEHNTTVMTGFGFNFPGQFFLEPNWTAINSHLKEIFNENEIITTVVDPYEPIVHNITLGRILTDSKSYSIQGKNDLADAKQLFTSTTSHWTFEFDYSGKIKATVFNNTAGYNNYIPYEIFAYKFEEGFTEGGVIERLHFGYEYKVTVNEALIHITQLVDYWLGGLGETNTSNFAYSIILPGLGLIVMFVKWSSKKK